MSEELHRPDLHGRPNGDFTIPQVDPPEGRMTTTRRVGPLA
ncbi:hypothetical protein [Actinoallomurus bryophytorum]|nr:hypothetical protein [Actinoallomurus bryophytorum]